VILGKVETGVLAKGDSIVLYPTKATCKVEALYTDETPVKYEDECGFGEDGRRSKAWCGCLLFGLFE